MPIVEGIIPVSPHTFVAWVETDRLAAGGIENLRIDRPAYHVIYRTSFDGPQQVGTMPVNYVHALNLVEDYVWMHSTLIVAETLDDAIQHVEEDYLIPCKDDHRDEWKRMEGIVGWQRRHPWHDFKLLKLG